MLKGFTNILIKELKELIRDPKILIGMIVLPLVMFPVLGLVFGYAQETAKNEATNIQLLVINNDGGNWSQTLIGYLSSGQLNVTVVNNLSPQQAVDQGILKKYNASTFIEIPAGFSQDFTTYMTTNPNVTATVNSYGAYQGGSIFSGISSSMISIYITSFNRAIAPNVVTSTTSSIIKGQVEQALIPANLAR